MNREEKLVSDIAKSFITLGFTPPEYKKPKWYNFRLKRKLAYYDKMGWPYELTKEEGKDE